MDVSTFLGARWRGEGEVRGLAGRVLRRFAVAYDGVWSEEHDAFHTDEVVDYADGRRVERKWAVSHRGLGLWSGFDDAAGRLRVWTRGDGLLLRFDRARGVRAPSVRTLRMTLTPQADGSLEGRGVTRWLGLPVARTHIRFSRTEDLPL